MLFVVDDITATDDDVPFLLMGTILGNMTDDMTDEAFSDAASDKNFFMATVADKATSSA